MGTNLRIPIGELAESRILVERSPDLVSSTHTISQSDQRLEIARLEVLSSTVVHSESSAHSTISDYFIPSSWHGQDQPTILPHSLHGWVMV